MIPAASVRRKGEMETGYKVSPVVRQPSQEAAAATHETPALGSASGVLTCQKVKFGA